MLNDFFIENKTLFFLYSRFFFVKIIIFISISIPNIISDIKNKEVNSLLLAIISSILTIISFFYNIKAFYYLLIGFFLIFIIFMFIYFVSSGGIGLGDMFYLFFINSIVGIFFTTIIFILTFWIATLILIPFLITRKLDKKSKIPLIPFFFIGFWVVWLIALVIDV